jgi:hypothetical protein
MRLASGGAPVAVKRSTDKGTSLYVNKYRNLRTQQMLVHSLVCIFHDMFRPLLVAIFRWFVI